MEKLIVICLMSLALVKGDVCELPKEVGPCNDVFPRWFYNSETEACESFDYGGCQGNDNNFENQTACQTACQEGGKCELPKKVEYCQSTSYPRWFYNPEKKACVMAFYKPCEGNASKNFHNQTDCQDACLEAGDVCQLSKDKGHCGAIIQRWFFNSEKETCELFDYGGCYGNANNFLTEMACQTACGKEDVCQLSKDKGPCKALFQRWFFNSEKETCELFDYGGCQGNRNNFITEMACQTTCLKGDVCELPKEVGPCEALIPRWFYNSETEACESFNYGGCQGNDNNFENQTACQAACQEEDVCQLSKDKGPCKAIIPRWFFNSENETCKLFDYGGCQGNANNFHTEMDCQTTCLKGDVCQLPKKVGPCQSFAANPRWFYNSQKEACELFYYGGCEGNANNFQNQTDCQTACLKDVCPLPKEIGPCRASIPRFFFNSENESCEMFYYGGCQGNANNFPNQTLCKTACLKGTGGSTGLQSSMVAMVLAVIAGWTSAHL